MMTTCTRRARRLAMIGMMALAGVLLAAGLGRTAAASHPAPYNRAMNYKPGEQVVGSDGNTYRAAFETTGNDPVTTDGATWQIAYVAKDTTLDVPGRFKTIADALQHLAGCRIAENVEVVILVAAGRHEHATPLRITHSQGNRIVVRGAGDEATPSVLVFDGANGIVIDDGSSVTLENLDVVSKNGSEDMGLIVSRASSVRMRHCRFSGFGFGAFVNGGSLLTAEDCSFTTKGDRDCVTVRNGARGVFIRCTVKATESGRSHAGFQAYNQGSFECVECVAEGWYSGFCAHTSSSMHLDRCIGRNNAHGASAWHSSSMNVIDCTFAGNAESGVAAFHSTGQIGGCQLTDNPAGVIVFGPALVGFDGKPTKIAGGRTGIAVKAGGRVWQKEPPRFERVGQEIDVTLADQAVIKPR